MLKAMSIESFVSDKRAQDECIISIINNSQYDIQVYHIDLLKEKRKVFDLEPDSNRRHFTTCGYQLMIESQ